MIKIAPPYPEAWPTICRKKVTTSSGQKMNKNVFANSILFLKTDTHGESLSEWLLFELLSTVCHFLVSLNCVSFLSVSPLCVWRLRANLPSVCWLANPHPTPEPCPQRQGGGDFADIVLTTGIMSVVFFSSTMCLLIKRET